MQHDVRNSNEFRAVETFYRRVYAPGTGHVYSVEDCAPAMDGTEVYLTGSSFRATLLDGPSTGIYRCRLPDGDLAPITAQPARLPRPAPDGSRVACMIREDDHGDEQLCLLDSNGMLVSRHRIEGLVEQLEWSPDGSTLLLLVAGVGADVAGYQGGYATSAVRAGPSWLPEVETGAEGSLWRGLWVLELSSGGLRCVSHKGTNVWEAAWNGLGRIAAVCSDDHGEGSWYAANLRLIALDDGSETIAYTPTDQIGLVACSRDAGRIAFVEAVCSDRGIICGTLMIAEAGVIRRLPTKAVEVTHLAWRNNDTLHFAGHEDFDTVVGDYDFRRSEAREIWRSRDLTCGPWYPAAWPLGEAASLVVVEAYDRAPAIAMVDSAGLRVIRSLAAPQAAEAMADCGHIAPVAWKAPDGLEIHGWLVTPGQVAGPVPLVLDIHGGPIWANRNRWMARGRATPLLVRLGCAVLYPNPRGSSTRGQEFARTVRGDMGGADTRDLLSALDHFTGAGLADKSRLACTGTSYGGFMSCWLVTQDSRFAAAAPISPVSNWFSQHRTSQIPFFDAAFLDDSPTRANGRFFSRSPAMFAEHVRTPCLVMAGARDKNTPPTQAREFHQSLREAGAKSALVTYPEDGHSLRGYPAYLDSAARILTWFGRHLALPHLHS